MLPGFAGSRAHASIQSGFDKPRGWLFASASCRGVVAFPAPFAVQAGGDPCLDAPAMKLARLDDGPEIFHTLQGEGPSAGSPAVFVRAALCNLQCVWCDSSHAWKLDETDAPAPGGASRAFVEIDPAEVAERVLAFDCPRLVLTGGEPMLQQAAWIEMLRRFRRSRHDAIVEVETNGTLPPEPDFDRMADQYNVSPKLANSGMPESRRLVSESLAHFASSPKAWFKFVVSRPADLDEIDRLVSRFSLPASRILLMPEGCDVESLDRRAAWLAPACLDRNFRLGDRLHIRLWGDRPGT